MEFDVDELYAGPWQDFVAHRDRLAAAARAAGDKPAALALKALREPTRGAWLINLLARHEAGQLAEVLGLGESLARAHRDADPDALRRLSALRGKVVESLTGRAAALGAERGYAAPESVRQEVSETIQAAMADPAVADRVLAGTMTETVRAAAFGPTDLFAAAPRMADVIPLRAEDAQPPAPQEPAKPDQGTVRRLRRDLGRAEARWKEARERLERAEAASAEARAAVQEQERELAEIAEQATLLRGELAAVEQDERIAQTKRDELAETAEEMRRITDRAVEETNRLEDVIDRLRRELSDLEIEF